MLLLSSTVPYKEADMKLNVGNTDRVVRVVVGILLLALIFILEGNARWWGLIGLIPLVTGLVGVCPAYKLLGMSTCPMEKKGG
jgi:hypothetical protein